MLATNFRTMLKGSLHYAAERVGTNHIAIYLHASLGA